MLWQAWENRTPDVGSRTLLQAANLQNTRLVDLFKRAGRLRPAWA
jgi:hypothetical protein